MLSEPLPYHVKIRDYFKSQSGLWSFFSASRKKEEQLASVKSDLLKNTYQFQPESHPLLYEKIIVILEKLGLGSLSVTVYQAAHSPELNASIVCLPGEAHMVFSGGIQQLLNELEMSAIIAHELAHIKFYSLLDGELEVSDRIISALASSPDSGAAHYETARLFQLYKEIYCDREAYRVLGDAAPVVTMLVKIVTGLSEVHAESVVNQAEEIFSRDATVQSASLTHPENFVRARALQLWKDQGKAEAAMPKTNGNAEAAISQMIEGVVELDRMDVLAQKQLTDLTRTLLTGYLYPEWLRTPVVTALAHQYFSDMELGKEDGADFTDRLKTYLTDAHASIREYFAYVLLDFALADPELEDVPLGHALQLAENIGLITAFEPIVKKELSYSDKQWDRAKLRIPMQK